MDIREDIVKQIHSEISVAFRYYKITGLEASKIAEDLMRAATLKCLFEEEKEWQDANPEDARQLAEGLQRIIDGRG